MAVMTLSHKLLLQSIKEKVTKKSVSGKLISLSKKGKIGGKFAQTVNCALYMTNLIGSGKCVRRV